jgi:hypothetical protein
MQFKHYQELDNGLAILEVYPDSDDDYYWTLISPETVATIKAIDAIAYNQVK